MKTDGFSHGLLRHGSDLERWPWLQRLAARRLLARSAQARRMLDQARTSEHALQRALAPSPLPDELLRRLDAIPQQFPRTSRATQAEAERRLLRIGAGWALACGVACLAVGASGWISTTADAEEAVRLALGSAAMVPFAADGAFE